METIKRNRSEYMKQYGQTHKEEIKKRKAEYFQTNKEILAQKQREYRQRKRELGYTWNKTTKKYELANNG